MPNKLEPYSYYGQKLISLFARLLFSRTNHSLTELSQMLNCSKQTILRLIRDIKRSYGVDIEESFEDRKKYYRIKTMSGTVPALNLTEKELNALHMCRAFTEHLLGREFFEDATRALEKSQALLPHKKLLPSRHFASFRPGSIDYTPYHGIIQTLIEAMEKRRVCKITYRSIMSKRAKTFYIKPLKIFSYYDTVYVDARLSKKPGRPYKDPDYDPLLAVHRIKKVEMTDRMFEYPKDYDFEKVFNKSFGVMKKESFEVEVEFTGYSARYASERTWSPDQKIINKSRDKLRMSFSASSAPELIAWFLTFEDEAKVLKPAWLIDKMRETIDRMQGIYG